MRNLLIAFIAFLGSCTYSNAQISIRTDVNVKQAQQVEKYDSLSNFDLNYDIIANEYQTEETALANINGQFKQFIGQSIYILPFTQKQLSFHKKWGSSDTKNDRLRGEYYTIDGFEFKLNESYTGMYKLDKVVFKLRNEDEKKSKWEVAYYSLDDALLVGYYEKLKQKYVGKSFVYTGRAKGKGCQFITEPSLDHSAVDTKTKQIINLRDKSEWLCTEIQLVDDEVTMQLYAILTNSDGNEIKARIENRFLTKGETNAAFFSCFMDNNEFEKWKDSIVEKYGLEYALLIIKKKVKIGMTDKMCIEAWGEPDSKNRTVLNGKETEQWVYKTGSYLYFDNGILTVIQN